MMIRLATNPLTTTFVLTMMIGCATTDTDDPGPGAEDPPVDPPAAAIGVRDLVPGDAQPGGGALALRVVDADGNMAPAPTGVFGVKGGAYLSVRLAEPSTTPFADGDLAFAVVDGTGAVLSTDALDCRRFRVETGYARVVEVYEGVDTNGAPCRHGWGTTDGHALLPQLAPFADATPGPDGFAEYAVIVARVDEIVDGVFPANAARTTFRVACEEEPPPPPEPVCGDGTVDDGEACDDGNTTDGDGCSAACVVEDCNG